MNKRTPYYAGVRRRYCVQSAGKHAGDGKENRQDNLQGSCPFQQYQHRNHERQNQAYAQKRDTADVTG